MNTHVMYASQYGHSERYARWIAEDLRAAGHTVRLCEAGCEETPENYTPEVIVFVGANYAGTINGIEAFTQAAHTFPRARLVVLTVAWASPEQREAIAKLHAKNIPADVLERAHVFHARGGIDHTRLSLKHKTGMAALKAFIHSKPESRRSQEDRETLEFWGKAKDFTTREAVAPVVAAALGTAR